MAHGKGARGRAEVKRLNQKRARKLARQAIWDALKGTAKNKKKKQFGTAGESAHHARVKMVVKTDRDGELVKTTLTVHGGPECGNIGCKRCSSRYQI